MNSFLSPGAKAAFSGEFNAKFLATLDPNGIPNVALIASIIPKDDSTLIFGQLMLQKTLKNLKTNPKMGFLVVDPGLRIWTGTGDLGEISESGPDMERLNSLGFIRYNAYTGFKAAFEIKIRELKEFGVLSKFGLLLAQTFAPGKKVLIQARDQGLVPPQVIDKFLRIKAVKVLGFMDPDGYPGIVPLLAVGFPEMDRIRLMIPGPGLDSQLKPGRNIAINVVTLDPISYQLKAEVLSTNRNRLEARITRAFSSSPPLPGEDLSAIKLSNR